MTSTLQVDNDLLASARRVGRHETDEDTVRCALEEYIRQRRQERIIELFGDVDFDKNWDYKADHRKGQPFSRQVTKVEIRQGAP